VLADHEELSYVPASWYRYPPVGVVPPTGDKDYILCNISLPQVDAGDALVASSMRINIIDAARAEGG
jgi:hypothetical protein